MSADSVKYARFFTFTKAIIVFLVVTVIAASWLAFPYLVQGRQILADVGSNVTIDKQNKSAALSHYLTQTMHLENQTELEALYATTGFFERSDQAGLISIYRPDQNFIFFVAETTHDFELPAGLPGATLNVGTATIEATSIEGPEVVDHHRTTVIVFPKFDNNGDSYISDSVKQITLNMSHTWSENSPYADFDSNTVESSFSWDYPVVVPDHLKEKDTISPMMLFSLAAGLLSAVLTPCLLQLLVVYMATMGGVTAEKLIQRDGLAKEEKNQLLIVAVYFVIGFVGLFTLAGAVIGYSGKEAQILFANASRPLSIASGIVVIIMGVWMAMRTRAPLLCKLPFADLTTKLDKNHRWSSAITAVAFSLGCISCFGGAIIATLFIYVGSLGSPMTGALIMFLFSVGVSIPFVLAAMFLNKMTPFLSGLSRYSQALGLVSSVIIIGFGIVLVTDNFHVISDLIYPWLGLN
jgi:cytochrome c-type biogenesis protein